MRNDFKQMLEVVVNHGFEHHYIDGFI